VISANSAPTTARCSCSRPATFRGVNIIAARAIAEADVKPRCKLEEIAFQLIWPATDDCRGGLFVSRCRGKTQERLPPHRWSMHEVIKHPTAAEDDRNADQDRNKKGHCILLLLSKRGINAYLHGLFPGAGFIQNAKATGACGVVDRPTMARRCRWRGARITCRARRITPPA
jgi:hypothetical protein